jgi:hypothetical protein
MSQDRYEAALRRIRQEALDAMNAAQATHRESLGDIAAMAGEALADGESKTRVK